MPNANTSSPYIAGCEDEQWGRHSYDQRSGASPAHWINRKSASTTDVTSSTISCSDNKQQRKQVLQHRLSAPSLTSHPSSTSTASLSSSASGTFRPWSSAGSAASSAADDNSGSPLTTTSVRFLGVSKNEAHCVYLVQVDTGAEQFVVQKRYSQFRDFRQQLFATLQRAAHCGNGPCKQLLQLTQVKFPRRKPLLPQWKKDADLLLARDRLLLLQRFVEAMLRVYRMAPRRQLRCCVNTQCAAMEAVREFLQIAATPDSEDTLAIRASMGIVVPVRDSELLHARRSTSPERDVDEKSALPQADTATAEPSRRQTRGFPPPTRASLPPNELDHQFEQLYPITEDSELVHLHA